MPTEAAIITEGKVVSVLPGTMFRVELENQHVVLAHLCGKIPGGSAGRRAPAREHQAGRHA